ncbi:hypothetical protein V8E54_012152 [Elaphomyces granulatus]
MAASRNRSAHPLSESEIPHHVSRTVGFSLSPNMSFHSSPSSFDASNLTQAAASAAAKHLKPFATEDIKILLLENVNQTGRDILAEQGYQIESLVTSISEDELINKIRDGHVIGIRSKNRLCVGGI